MKNQDVKVCLLLMAVSLAAWVTSYYFPETSIWAGGATDRPYQASAGTWPRIVAVALFVLSAMLILAHTLIPQHWLTKEEVECDFDCLPEEEVVVTPKAKKNAIRFFAVFAAYMLLLTPLGFPLATLLFGAGCVLALDLGKMSKVGGLAWSTGVSAIIVVLFCRILYLPLPRGMGIFRELSHMIIF